MTDAQVRQIIASAAARGRAVDKYGACVYLQAREILARDPQNEAAAEVVQNFAGFLATGVEAPSLAEFYLPCPYTDEEIAERERDRERYLASVKNAG